MTKGRIALSTAGLAIVLASCVSSEPAGPAPLPPVQQPATRGQALSEAEAARVAHYKTLTTDVLVDELLAAGAQAAFYDIDASTQAYEGYRVLQLLGLDTSLSLEQQYRAIEGLFGGIPVDLPANGAGIRNVVIGSWYRDGVPLVLQVVKLKAGPNPAAVILFNTRDGIRRSGHAVAKLRGPAFDYPRVWEKDGGTTLEAEDYYAVTILDDGRLSASRAIGKALPAFETVLDAGERVNLTDDYLRDGSRENDAAALPVLQAIAGDTTVSPIVVVHAHIQLFMYYLFSGDIDAARAIAATTKGLSALDDPAVKDTEIATVARRDLDRILKIALTLGDGDAGRLAE